MLLNDDGYYDTYKSYLAGINSVGDEACCAPHHPQRQHTTAQHVVLWRCWRK